MGFVVVVHGVNLVVMDLVLVLTLILGNKNFIVHGRRVVKQLAFSDTSRGIDNAYAKNVIPLWNVEKETKHRVWQSFWRVILLDLAVSQLKPADNTQDVDIKPLRLDDVKSVSRSAEFEEAIVSHGLQAVKSHWHGRQFMYTGHLRVLARTALEGVDVCWNNPESTRDGHLDSVSCFGKMYVVPYPFHCVVVYDDGNDEAIVKDECDENSPGQSHSNLAKLLSTNFTPEVLPKRELRQKLRVLSDTKTVIELTHTRKERVFVRPIWRGWTWPMITLPGYYKFKCTYTYGVIQVHTSSDPVGDECDTITCIKGWISTQIRRKWVQYVVTKVNEAFRSKSAQNVKQRVSKLGGLVDPAPQVKPANSKRIMADGFNVSFTYCDGKIADRDDKDIAEDLPDAVRAYLAQQTRKLIMKADHIGLKPSMDESDTLRSIFKQTRYVWEKGLMELRYQLQQYRRNLLEAHEKKNAALGDDFWYYVYNNPRLPRAALEIYLRDHELNSLLRKLPRSHTLALDELYRQQEWVFRDPRTTFWYVFWDDVYACNSNMECLKPEDFDPLERTSICSKEPMNQDKLENWLRKKKVLTKSRYFDSLFSPVLLDLLYEKMNGFPRKEHQSMMERISTITRKIGRFVK